MPALVGSHSSDLEQLRALTVDDAWAGAWDDARLVAQITAAERQSRAAAARAIRLTAVFARRHPEPSTSPGDDGLPGEALDELSVACGLARGSFAYRLRDARDLDQRFPKLLDAWEAGLLNSTAVHKALETAQGVPDAARARLEQSLLRRLGRPTHADLAEMTLAQMRAIDDETAMTISSRATTATVGRIMRDLVARIAPESRAARRVIARSRRLVRLEDGSDGMSWLHASLISATAWASYEHVDALARALPDHPDDDRTLDAKRADVFIDLLLGAGADGAGVYPDHTSDSRGHTQGMSDLPDAPEVGDPTASARRAPGPRLPAALNLQVLLDHTRCGPGSGCVADAGRLGPVTAETVVELIAMTLQRGGSITGGHVTAQPCPGPAEHGRLGPGTYEPGEALKRFVRARSRSCVWPGCDRVARACELDHTVPYPAGPTCECNLAPLCIYHHHVKHRPGVGGRPGWRLVNHGDGHLTWTTPTGRAVEVWPERKAGPAEFAQGP